VKVADWTPWIFGVAATEAFITFIGIVLVGLTLHYTRRAAEAARDAVAEAKEATQVAAGARRDSQEQSERELRAYLAVEPAKINRLYNLNSEAVGHVLVRNVGKLPARNVQVVVNLRWDQNKAFAPNTFPADVIEDRAIQPGASMRQGAPDYIPILTARQPDNYIFVWGIVRYDDGYGYRRFTKFCHRYSGASHFRGVSPLPTEYLAVIIEAEKARYHPAGNDSD
jgi:hypothetical protein